MEVENTIAYHDTATITSVKKFYTTGLRFVISLKFVEYLLILLGKLDLLTKFKEIVSTNETVQLTSEEERLLTLWAYKKKVTAVFYLVSQ